jgi:hypothetical protein
MVEGPNAELSPVYPKKLQPMQPQSNAVSPAAAGNTPVSAETAQKPGTETTGAATGADNPSKAKGVLDSAHNAQAYAAQPNQNKRDEAATSNNRCDVQACGSAYKSFRASDCTYQPFDGPRRVCGKAPEQRADREQRNESKRRSWNRREDADADSRDVDRRTRWRVYDEDDNDGADDMFLFRRSRRW